MARAPDPTVDQPPTPDQPQTGLQAAQDDPSDLFGEGNFLLYDEEVGGIVNSAIRDEWGHDQVKAALQQTNAFKEVSDRRQALADPATGGQAQQELSWRVAAMLGRAPDDPVARDMTRRMAAGAATWSSLSTLADPMQLGTPTSRVQELAAVHGLPMSEGTAAEYAGMPEEQVDQELGFLSQQMYPYKPAGAPWQRFAGVFADIHRAELGKDVSTTDPSLVAKIEQAQGNPGVFRQLVRQTPEWEQSDTGQRLFQERSDQLLHDLSYGSAATDQMNIQGQQYQIQEAVGSQAAQPVSAGGGGGGSYGGGEGTRSMAGLSQAEAWIVQRESGGRTGADNPTSTAFGLGQLLYANRVRYAKMVGASGPDTTDYGEQLAMFRAYVRDRYGTAEKAKAFWQANGWY